MFCPECNLENPAGTKFCTNCGCVLTQTEITAPSAHRTNQVWNTEIEKEHNQKNSRTAMIVLGIAAVLIIALIAAVFVSLPSMGDALMGVRDEGESFTNRLSAFWDDLADSFDYGAQPEPEPGIYAEIQGEADEEFLELLEEYLEGDYNLDYTERLTLPEQYVEKFEALLTADFADEELVTCAIQIVGALRSMRDSVDSYSGKDSDSYIADYPLWLAGYTTLCQVATELYHTYGIMPHAGYIPEYYADMLPIYEAELMAEQDLMWQLIGTEPQWSPVHGCYILTYTNCTEYELDITFYNDYETANDYFYEEQTITGIMPGERVVILLQEMPEEYENWYTDWIIEEYYIDGTAIYDYYW